MGIKTGLKIESFAFFDNSCFMATELCKARISALALPIRVSSSSSCLPSLLNASPKCLNFSLPASVLHHSLDQSFLKDGKIKYTNFFEVNVKFNIIWKTKYTSFKFFYPFVWRCHYKYPNQSNHKKSKLFFNF